MATYKEIAASLDIDAEKLPDRIDVKKRPADSDSIRVMQWNILAGGMSDDGFLVHDILDNSKAAELGAVESLEAIYKDVEEAKKAGAGMEDLQKRLATKRARKNHSATVDWKLRWERMKEVIAEAKPSVITLQELDHMTEAQAALETLGYKCAMSDSCGSRPAYRPAHKEALPADDCARYKQHLESVGVAYAPNYNSTCRRLALKEDEKDETADDDGVAIFWLGEELEAKQIDFLPVLKGSKDRYGALVRVTLTRTRDDFQFCVICAHLPSGDSGMDEEKRVGSLWATAHEFQSPMSYLRESLIKSPTLFCLDANSAPTRSEQKTVWKLLCKALAFESVWKNDFTPDARTTSKSPPVSTNKMRGPLSGQAKKIGEHMCHVIDHIFFSTEFSMIEHAFEPPRFEDKNLAAASLLPSLAIPSDHYPVIVDFQRKPREPDERPEKKSRGEGGYTPR